MVSPPGIGLDGKILGLDKALYGLKQAPLAWLEELSEALAEIGFISLPFDLYVFILRTTGLLLWYMLMTSALPHHDQISIVLLIIFILGSRLR